MVGATVGEMLGFDVLGDFVGATEVGYCDGNRDGALLVGCFVVVRVGECVGWLVVGVFVGVVVVGAAEGCVVVGPGVPIGVPPKHAHTNAL